MTPPDIVAKIAKILDVRMEPAPVRGRDKVSGVIAVRKKNDNERVAYYAADGDRLLGLNLAGCELTDERWEQICGLSGFNAAELEALNLRDNALSANPLTSEMRNLRMLDLSNNQLREVMLPVGVAEKLEQVILTGLNDLSTPPLEIVAKGKPSIIQYFKRLDAQGAEKLFEAKVLILGAGGSGKTTLARKLLSGMDTPMPGEHESTHGIEVKVMENLNCNGEPFKAHIWDFGGQEIYHATHQFFLTKRSLYLLVADARKEDTDFDYWLQIIELLGGDSPVIIVQNQKGGRTKDLNEPALKSRFNNIRGFKYLDLANSDHVEKLLDLKKAIENNLTLLPHVGNNFPKEWALVRNKLESLEQEKRKFIGLHEYLDLCKNFLRSADKDALLLSQFLHDLGVILHFQEDPVLKHLVIISNSWATDGVYWILDAEKLKQTNGRFTKADAKNILKSAVEYQSMFDEILQLMLKFEICYKVLEGNQDNYIAPQLLKADEPEDLIIKSEHIIQFQYDYTFMPKGLVSRLIVRLNRYIEDHINHTWKSGAFFRRSNATAKVVEAIAGRNIKITVQGKQSKELLTIISEEMDRLHNSYHNLKVKKLVPCNCSECRLNSTSPFFYDYNVLEKAKSKNVPTIQCQNSFEQVNVLGLIDDVFVTTYFKQRTLNIFVSYSQADRVHLDALKKHLTILRRDEALLTWDDSDLKPGEEWDKGIRRQLASADIILLLVSADFMATEYIWKEIDIAMSRHERNEAVVVPIIIRPCDWKLASFARLNALPEKGHPITKWPNEDEAWTQVVNQIRRISEILIH